MHARDIISTHPDVKGNVSESLVRCVDECYVCAQACTACADACLAEEMVQQLKECIPTQSRLCGRLRSHRRPGIAADGIE